MRLRKRIARDRIAGPHLGLPKIGLPKQAPLNIGLRQMSQIRTRAVGQSPFHRLRQRPHCPRRLLPSNRPYKDHDRRP